MTCPIIISKFVLIWEVLALSKNYPRYVDTLVAGIQNMLHPNLCTLDLRGSIKGKLWLLATITLVMPHSKGYPLVATQSVISFIPWS